MSNYSNPENAAVAATDDRAALDSFVSTLSANQAQQMTTILLALGALNPHTTQPAREVA